MEKEQSIKEMYDDIVKKWEDLRILFSKNNSQTPPRLAVYTIRGTEDMRNLEETIQFYPEPSEIESKEIIRMIAHSFGVSCCDYAYNMIMINKAEEELEFIIAEEVTHSAQRVKDNCVHTPTETVIGWKVPYPKFGQQLYKTLQSLNIISFNQNIDEFFTPIGQTYLRGKYHHIDWEKKLKKFRKRFYTRKRAQRTNNILTLNLVEHIPSSIGGVLVDLYNHDVEALIRENPELPHLDGTQLWEQYCMPLLLEGEIK